jgi:hypothetical protein
MGVGAGIVYDSRADEEFAECQLKAKFLTGLPAQFELFETMYATREQGCRYWTRHLQRLRRLPSISALSGMKKRSSAQYKGSVPIYRHRPHIAYVWRLMRKVRWRSRRAC